MKLSDYAKEVGVSYRTAWRWYKEGKIQGHQMPTGTVIITEKIARKNLGEKAEKTAIYTRVSATESKSNLEQQSERLVSYCMAKGYQVNKIVKEVGSGINDSRPQLLKLISDPTITRIVVEHKDRLTRFGFNYIEQLFKLEGRQIEVVNLAEDGKQDLVEDLVSIIYSFCTRLYGQRRSKRKTERIIAELKRNDDLG